MEPVVQGAEQVATDLAAVANWPRLAHVFGVIVYVGSLLAIARILALLATAPPEARSLAAAKARNAHMSVSFPGLLILLLAGIHSVFSNPEKRNYFREPWFVMKLTLVLLLITVDHVLIVRPLKALAKDDKADLSSQASLFRAGFWVVGLLFFAILMSVYVFRFA